MRNKVQGPLWDPSGTWAALQGSELPWVWGPRQSLSSMNRYMKGFGDHHVGRAARLGVTALMNTEFLDEAGTGLPTPWISWGSHWQEGSQRPCRFTAAGSPPSSLPSQLTGVSGQLLPSKCVLTSKSADSKCSSCCSLASTLNSGSWSLLDQVPSVPRVLSRDVPMWLLPVATFFNVPIFTV